MERNINFENLDFATTAILTRISGSHDSDKCFGMIYGMYFVRKEETFKDYDEAICDELMDILSHHSTKGWKLYH